MEYIQARTYETAAVADEAFKAIARTIDRLDLHAIATRATLTEPTERPLVVISYDDKAIERVVTTGHWLGGVVMALEPAWISAFEAMARRKEQEAGGEDLSEFTQYAEGSTLNTAGEVVDAEEEEER